MPRAGIVTRPSHTLANSEPMDVVAIVLGIAMFAILLLIIEGIDRI
jgi:hypothetical protein